jgi:hypothetical protein
MYCSYSVTEIELMEQMAVHQKNLNISSSFSRCPKKQNSKLMCFSKIGFSILFYFTFPEKMLVFLNGDPCRSRMTFVVLNRVNGVVLGPYQTEACGPCSCSDNE